MIAKSGGCGGGAGKRSVVVLEGLQSRSLRMEIYQPIEVGRCAEDIVKLRIANIRNSLYHVIARCGRCGSAIASRIAGRIETAHVIAVKHKHAAVFASANQFVRMSRSI